MICPHCGKDTELKTKFDDYIAILIDDIYPDENSMWGITRKEFWYQNYYLDGSETGLTIPDFNNCMENTYEYCGKKSLDEVAQSEVLRSLGFFIRPLSLKHSKKSDKIIAMFSKALCGE